MSGRTRVSTYTPRIVLCALLSILSGARPATAQTRPAPIRLPRVEMGGGVIWSGVSKLGALNATMTANQPGDNPDRVPFFNVDSRIQGAPGANGWIGGNVSQSIGVEGGFQYSQPDIRTRVTGDVEGAADATLDAGSITQTIVEGNVLVYFNAGRFDQERTVPFVLVGAGYFRQTNSAESLDETGRIYQAGVGFKWVSGITRARRARGPGMRIDVRYVLRDGGLDFRDTARRPYVTASLTASMAF
jgi:hypothetical protein